MLIHVREIYYESRDGGVKKKKKTYLRNLREKNPSKRAYSQGRCGPTQDKSEQNRC